MARKEKKDRLKPKSSSHNIGEHDADIGSHEGNEVSI